MNNIPLGWKKVKLKQLSTDGILNGIFNDPKKVGAGTPLINVIDLYQDKIDYDNLSCLDVTDKELEQYQVLKGDLLFTRSSLKLEGIARCNIVDNEHKKMVFDCHIMRIRPDQHIIKPYYLFAYCNTNMAKMQFMKNSKTTTMTTIDQNGLGDIDVFVPPIAEQEKIAEILGTWDRAIEELTGLIAEKKELKRGLMQRLLTGTQRLPGFTKPWKKIKLSDVLEECVETTTTNNQYEILTSSRRGIFRQEDYFDKQVASQDNIGYKIIRNGDFTYRAMTDDDKFCFNQLTDFEIGIVSPAYAVFRTKKIPGNILKFILNSERFGYELLKEAQGGTRKSLKYNSLIKLQIYVPDDEEEMARLSECLHIADSEIDLLNQQLDVLKEQKRGLMQKLLTGEIRVKADTETC